MNYPYIFVNSKRSPSIPLVKGEEENELILPPLQGAGLFQEWVRESLSD
jgi:hypothetical protein